jgi:N-methylhydantoinase A/oxoprolinase/acetone carboxylase beta subunit
MTDALVTDGQALRSIKVDTTPHDFTVCLKSCLLEAAKQLGFSDLTSFLDQVRLIRWSSTIASNVLAERRGPKIGLLVSTGHEENLYGNDRSPAVGALVARPNVVGLPPEPDASLVLGTVKRLFEEGVRRVCISLHGAFPVNDGERHIKAIIETQYPDHYLGSVPVLLGSDMAQTPDDMTRTHYSLINAYVHTPLAASLFKAEDLLKYEERWNGPLLIGHTNGGVARVGKTKAVDTVESGPVFGTFAGAYFARQYGLDSVVCLDVGGTTAKASMVRGGDPVFQRGGDLIGIPVQTSFALLRSVAIGGGSIARPNESGKGVRLGPESMGASPGPACYGLGGNEATLTDAFITLGYLDPDRFLGGRRRLDVDKARQMIERRVAQPLGVPVERAAGMIAECAFDVVAGLIKSTVQEAGQDPAGVTLFAYGGNGPLVAAPVAERLGIPRAYVFSLGPAFGALGSAISDVVHVYERSLMAELRPSAATDQLQAALEAMRSQAHRDLKGEGFDSSEATLRLEVELSDGQHGPITVRLVAPKWDAAALAKQLLTRYKQEAPAEYSRKQVVADVVRLEARYHIGSYDPTPQPEGSADATQARLHERSILLSDGEVHAPIYEWERLQSGAVVTGPAIGAAGNTTCLVPSGWELIMDCFANGLLQRR